MSAQSVSRQLEWAHTSPATERCPTCEQAIPHERAEAVRARFAAQEKTLVEKAQAAAARRFEVAKAELARQHADALAAARAELVAQSQAALEAAERERTAALEQCERLRAEQESLIGARVQAARDALERDHADKSAAKEADYAERTHKLTEKLQDLTRQLEKKTAEELGEGAEVKLFEALRSEFDGDVIERVSKGVAGADIVHTVMHNGRACGKILYDSKNRRQWRHDYVSKLLSDQTAAKADHAVLCTLKFPEGARQLLVCEGVIVINPARAVALVSMLRKHMISVQTLRLSKSEREKKTAALYDFVTSERCRLLLGRIDSAADSLLELQQAEIKAHEKHWAKQGEQLRSIQKLKAELDADVDRILGSDLDAGSLTGTEAP